MNQSGKTLVGANVLILGVAFKRDIDDARNSPAERVIELLIARQANISFHDPYVSEFHIGNSAFHRTTRVLQGVDLDPASVRAADIVVIITGHRNVDYAMVLENAKCVVDTTNATAALSNHKNIVRLGTANHFHTPENGANGKA